MSSGLCNASSICKRVMELVPKGHKHHHSQARKFLRKVERLKQVV